jgi:hypothetical protein
MEGRTVSFADVVRNTPEIAECLKAGLQALGANRGKIIVNSTGDLKGSVDIDTCVKDNYPNEHRWDYVLGYKDHIYYVEVHPANTGEVKIIIEKLDWLKQWRKRSAPRLEAAQHSSTYHWISSGKTAIAKRSRYRRILAQKGIFGPKFHLTGRKIFVNTKLFMDKALTSNENRHNS